jgi:hypothetical protein
MKKRLYLILLFAILAVFANEAYAASGWVWDRQIRLADKPPSLLVRYLLTVDCSSSQVQVR